MSSWLDQPRTLEIVRAGLPKWRDECLFTVSRLKGTEKLGRLYDYTVEVATKDDTGLTVHEAKALVEVDKLVGRQVTAKIAIEGSGTYGSGKTGAARSVNIGAGVREITGLIVSAQCVGSDTRRAFYRLRIRPWLFLATLNQDSRIFQDKSVVEISETILKKYPFHYDLRLAGPGFGRQYPKRDYQRMFWESDWGYLDRLWQEWGITFFYDGPTLVLCDSTTAYRKRGPAYETLLDSCACFGAGREPVSRGANIGNDTPVAASRTAVLLSLPVAMRFRCGPRRACRRTLSRDPLFLAGGRA